MGSRMLRLMASIGPRRQEIMSSFKYIRCILMLGCKSRNWFSMKPSLVAFEALIILVFVALSCPSALAAHKKTILKVPVFYVTDRNPVGDGFGPKRLLENDTVSAMQSGIVDVSIARDDESSLAEWQKTGLTFDKVETSDEPKLRKFDCHTAEDLKGEFDSKIRATLASCQRKEVFVSIHGFNMTFAEAAKRAAELSYYTGTPVLLYSWPSAGKLSRYSLDECNNEWSQEHFNEFLEHLNELKRSDNLQFNLVAHSMGNRLFVRGIGMLKGQGIFKDIFLVNPDFDAQTFIHYLSRYLPKDGVVDGVRGQLLVSRKDKALCAAESLFGGYTRLGQAADFALSAVTRPDLFRNVWLNPSAADSANAGVDAFARAASIERAIKVVDVTALDHGFIGHHVPNEYIAWMHYSNEAPPGFKLNEETSKDACNRISSFLSRLGGHKINRPIGKYLLVSKSQKQL